MRWSLTGCVLMLMCLAVLSTGCNPQATTESKPTDPVSDSIAEITNEEPQMEDGLKTPVELTLTEAVKAVSDGTAVLVDVRSDDEWNASHFAQAQHISIDKINEDAKAACAGLDKEQLVLLH